MKEVLDQFALKDTSLKNKEIPITDYPILTICFKPPFSTGEFDYGNNISYNGFGLKLSKEQASEYETSIYEYDYSDETTDIKLRVELQPSLHRRELASNKRRPCCHQ